MRGNPTTRTNPTMTDTEQVDPLSVVLPTHRDGEIHVLCSLLAHGKPVAELILPMLRPDDFHFPAHRTLYEAIAQSFGEGRDVTPETVAEVLSRLSGRLESCGGINTLKNMADDAPAARGAALMAQTLNAYAERRALIAAAQKQAVLAADTMSSMDTVRSRCLALTQSAVNLGNLESHTERSSDLAPRMMSEIRERRLRGSDILGIASGLRSWDLTLSGLIPGRLNIMAGRPGMGKTAAMLSIAINAARKGTATIIFSLEMANDELWYRALAQISGVNSQIIATGMFNDEEESRIAVASSQLSRMPLSFNDASGMTPRRIESVTRKFIADTRSETAPLMLIDYAQLVSVDDPKRSDTEAQAIKQNVYEIKAAMRDMGCANLTLAQLNRNVERREDKRPVMSDLEGSGGLEQVADSITFLYRPEYYRQQATLEANGASGEEAERAEEAAIREAINNEIPPDEAEWIVAKVRGGVPRRLKMTFHPTRTLFTTGGLEMRGF